MHLVGWVIQQKGTRRKQYLTMKLLPLQHTTHMDAALHAGTSPLQEKQNFAQLTVDELVFFIGNCFNRQVHGIKVPLS